MPVTGFLMLPAPRVWGKNNNKGWPLCGNKWPPKRELFRLRYSGWICYMFVRLPRVGHSEPLSVLKLRGRVLPPGAKLVSVSLPARTDARWRTDRARPISRGPFARTHKRQNGRHKRSLEVAF